MNELKQQLRQITAQAITAARQAADALTQSIYTSGLQKLVAEVSAGRKYAVIMSLKAGNDYAANATTNRGQVLPAEALTGVAAAIWNRFAGFKRSLQYWSRVEGCQRDEYIVDGFNIVLEWTDADEVIAAIEKLGPSQHAATIRDALKKSQAAVAEKAKEIITRFQQAARLQAESGKNWAIMMSLKPGVDYIRPEDCRLHEQAFDPAWLCPIAKAVFEACEEFETAFEFWSHVEGSYRDEYTVSGFNLIVRW